MTEIQCNGTAQKCGGVPRSGRTPNYIANADKSAAADHEINFGNDCVSRSGPISPRYLHYLGGAALIWAVAILAFVWIVDPYGVSPVRVGIAGLNKFKPKRYNIDRIIKPFEVWRYQPRTVFLGSSRIQQSVDPATLNGTKYAPAYNAAVPAATVAENVALLDQYSKIDRNLKHVFLEVFLYAFIGPTSGIPEKDKFDFIGELPSLNFSQSAFWASVQTIDYNLTSMSQPPSIAPGGYALKAHQFDPSMYFVPQSVAQYLLEQNKISGRMQLYGSTLDALKRAQQIADERGIELTFVVTPNFPWDDYRLYSAGYWDLIRQLYTALSKYPRVYSFAQFNELTGEPVSPTMKYWRDVIHFSRDLGGDMVRSLAGMSPDVPKNFMVPINPQTLESALALRTEGLRQWAGQHHDFVDLYDRTQEAVRRNGEAGGALDIANRTLTVDGIAHEIVSQEAGAVETVVPSGDHMVVTGWAVDSSNKLPVRNVVATLGLEVVSKWFPGAPRQDIESLYGRGVRPASFVMRVNRPPAAAKDIRVFALMEDGRAVQLASDPLVAGGSLVTDESGPKASVRRNGDKVYILTEAGKSIELVCGGSTPDVMVGAIEGFSTSPSTVHGWAVDPDAGRPAQVVFIVDDKVLAWVIPSYERSDIAAGLGAGNRWSGFAVKISNISPAELKRMRAYAVLRNGTARELAYPAGDERVDKIAQSGPKASVKHDGSKVYIVTDDGKSIELVDHGSKAGDVLTGTLEGFTPKPDTFHGWAIDPAAGGPAEVVFIVDDRVLAWATPNNRRSDLATGLGPAYERSGFAVQIPPLSPADLKRVRAYAVQQNGTARELGYASGFGGKN